jgi:hypothetical protein
MPCRPLNCRQTEWHHDQQAQAVAGGHQIGAGAFALGQQRHLRRAANGPRKVAGGPHAWRGVHAMHARRMAAVQPAPNAPAQHQRPHNAQRDGPPQAAHQRRDLRREVQPQRGANRPLARIAQRPPAFGGRARMDSSAVASSGPIIQGMGVRSSTHSQAATRASSRVRATVGEGQTQRVIRKSRLVSLGALSIRRHCPAVSGQLRRAARAPRVQAPLAALLPADALLVGEQHDAADHQRLEHALMDTGRTRPAGGPGAGNGRRRPVHRPPAARGR